MSKATNAERCSVFIHDPQNDKVWLKVGTDVSEHGISVPKEGSVVGQVITSGEAVLLSELDNKSAASKLVQEQTGFETKSMLCVPIRNSNRNEITGAFQLLNKRDADSFNDEDMALAIEIAEHMQDQVDSVYLGQEIFGLSEKLYVNIFRTFNILIGSVVILLAVVTLMLVAYILLPWLA